MARVWISLLALILFGASAQADPRIKDIADIEGVRDNVIVGYGLVVGLNGTGDTLRNAAFTREYVNRMMERFDIRIREADIRSGNIASVMITAQLPPFATAGSRIDVSVASIGDASSLQGGILLAAPLQDVSGNTFVVAQGSVAVGGFSAGGDAASITRGVPTTGRIANGGIVERENPYDLMHARDIRIALRNPDFTTARRMAQAINAYIGSPVAQATDPATVKLTRPDQYPDMIGLIAAVEQLRVEADLPARVIIDEATGTIVMGENVRVSTVAIAQGNLTISVSETPLISQPNPLANGQTAEVPRTQITAEEDMAQLGVLPETVSLRELVDGLNALGVTPRDMITILQTIKAAGALQAEIEVL
ncbi:flagellar basal body P-ring protein FlgI [Woodsholea maritima]|uniref:flagellar basal body P-ring protein FlgI n=1 Tax=Woodsholea maritima TaxID=240237 RepID=UPI0003775CB5|nr:flagellar basal body P-ring protein FlgI [Woodsholea maritima]